MSTVKVVLKQSPSNPENGVWIDGVKIPHVVSVSVSGAARDVPRVSIVVVPTTVELEANDPEITQLSNG